MEKNKIYLGSNKEVLKTFEDNSVDSIVTDPPYELGFMNKKWDNSGIAYDVELWKECLRVLKPGGHLLSFGGTRTYHRMAVAIEDAGFEIRDMIEWVYGSGFPKSHNIGKAVDKLQGNERKVVGESKYNARRPNPPKSKLYKQGGHQEIVTKGTSEWEGWGTALKPSHEPICMARKPLSEKTVAKNVLKWKTGGINIDESRVGYADEKDKKILDAGNSRFNRGNYSEGGQFNKSADGVKSTTNNLGRFPANLIHNNSEEVRDCFPETKSINHNKMIYRRSQSNSINSKGMNEVGKSVEYKGYDDQGNASRYFKSIIYQPKASKKDRGEGNNHPTVKPIALMEYLIKMVTPKGGLVLDPFAGSGSTLVAAKNLNYEYVGIELTEEYIPIINNRLNN